MLKVLPDADDLSIYLRRRIASQVFAGVFVFSREILTDEQARTVAAWRESVEPGLSRRFASHAGGAIGVGRGREVKGDW
jgi:hypothetical protein